MRIRSMSFIIFFIMNTAALAQTSNPHDGTRGTNDGKVRNNPGLSTDTSKPSHMTHGGLVAPHATNDRGVIPANPSTDNGMRNPGRSQSLIPHSEPKSQ
jgi:hypothetical protein